MAILKKHLVKMLPKRIYYALRCLRNWRDIPSVILFLRKDTINLSFKSKLRIVKQLYLISLNIDSPHTQGEILSFMSAVFNLSPANAGVIVEAGCFKGGSTAKFSIAAEIKNRKLVVFDSFQGMPENYEQHIKDINGRSVGFAQGGYCGNLEEVKRNVQRFGKIKNCKFIPGWFDETMPNFKAAISIIYLDVDLASSTRTCLKYLYPFLESGGVLFSQDGHLPLVIQVFEDDNFWINEVGCNKPHIEGLGTRKLVKIVKE